MLKEKLLNMIDNGEISLDNSKNFEGLRRAESIGCRFAVFDGCVLRKVVNSSLSAYGLMMEGKTIVIVGDGNHIFTLEEGKLKKSDMLIALP